MSGASIAAIRWPAALLAGAMLLVTFEQPAVAQGQSLADANAALQAGEADKALALLASLPSSGAGLAQAHNLLCRVHLTLEQWDSAATECEQAVHLDAQNSDYHLWLGQALGEKASRASFLNAYGLAKRTRAEFEEAVRLNASNAAALADLGEFYRQAPGVIGGGLDKAQTIAGQLDKVDAGRGHELHGRIAEQQKDLTAAEAEYKKMIATDAHAAFGWSTLASYYARQQRFTDMESAVESARTAAMRDKHSAVALFDCAGLLAQANRDPALAATMLQDYLSSAGKTEEAPAFVAHLRLARLKQQLGDHAAAERERTAALALAHEYKPAQDFKAAAVTTQSAATQLQAKL